MNEFQKLDLALNLLLDAKDRLERRVWAKREGVDFPIQPVKSEIIMARRLLSEFNKELV